MEVNAVVRAHAAALGANALLCYTTTPEESTSRTSRNQVYHMLSATGHAVVVEEESEPLERAVNADPTDRRLTSAVLKRKSSMGSVLDAIGGWGERARAQANIGSMFPSKPTKPADIAGRWEDGDEGGRYNTPFGGADASSVGSFEPPSPSVGTTLASGAVGSTTLPPSLPTPPPGPVGSTYLPELELPPAALGERWNDRADPAAVPEVTRGPTGAPENTGSEADERGSVKAGPPRITRAHTYDTHHTN